MVNSYLAEWEGGWHNYHIVIPFDYTTWGITPKDDLWFSYSVESLGLRDLDEFNNIITSTLDYLSDKRRSINEYADLWKAVNSIDFNNRKHIEQVIDNVFKYDWYKAQLVEYGEDTIIHRTLTQMKKDSDTDSMMNTIMNSLKPTGFLLQQYGPQGLKFTNQTQECWSDGECLMIRRDYFEKLFKV